MLPSFFVATGDRGGAFRLPARRQMLAGDGPGIKANPGGAVVGRLSGRAGRSADRLAALFESFGRQLTGTPNAFKASASVG